MLFFKRERDGVTLRLAEALQRSVTFCRWLIWRRCLSGDSRAGMLLSPPVSVCGWAEARAWSLEDSVVEVMVSGKKKVTEIL